MHQAFSEAWAQAYCEALNANTAYRQAAANWEGGLILAVEADPALQIETKRGVYLDLWHGECRAARVATAEDFAQAPFVVLADLHTWKRVADGELNAAAALTQGKLKVDKGDIAVLLRFITAALELANTARQVPTTYPEGL